MYKQSVFFKIKEYSMAAKMQEKTSKFKYNDEFEQYLKNQCMETTFNGIEIESFSWYKKMLGIK